MTEKSLTIAVALPDHGLTTNRGHGNFAWRRRLVDTHRDAAMLVGYAAIPPEQRPFFAGGPVFAVCRVERRKRGNRWDYGGMVEALKPAFDGLQGIVYANDSQVAGSIILWDEKPTGTGLVHVTFMPLARVRWDGEGQ